MAERRRGEELETALLDAAWEELQTSGFEGLTMDAVATRAGTSRTVLYRRWDGKQELVRDTLARVLRQRQPLDPDTGSLRGDILALLQALPARRDDVMAALSVQLRSFFTATGTTPAQMRNFISGEDPGVIENIYERAIARGEVDAAALTDRIKRLPFVLMRDEVLSHSDKPNATAVKRAAKDIVDTILLPLVTPANKNG